jgi:hypothetical protein
MIQNIEKKTKRELIEIVKFQEEEYTNLIVDYDKSQNIIDNLLKIPKVEPLNLPIGFECPPFATGGLFERPAPPEPPPPRIVKYEIGYLVPIFCVFCAAVGYAFWLAGPR